MICKFCCNLWKTMWHGEWCMRCSSWVVILWPVFFVHWNLWKPLKKFQPCSKLSIPIPSHLQHQQSSSAWSINEQQGDYRTMIRLSVCTWPFNTPCRSLGYFINGWSISCIAPAALIIYVVIIFNSAPVGLHRIDTVLGSSTKAH